MASPRSSRDGTVAAKINREGVVLLGWGRAILLQIAHPLVAAAVADYSHFNGSAGGYVRRVRRTVGGMLGITFGDPEAAQRIIDRINGIHGKIHGTLREDTGVFPAGTPYSATDPRLLRWVHITLVESMVQAYEQLVGPLTPAEKDEFCVEAADTGRRLGIADADLPKEFVALQAAIREAYDSGEIVVGTDARALAASLLAPPLGPVAAPLFRVTTLVTVGMLPAAVREGYGFRWDARRDHAFRVVMACVKRVRWALPAMLREWPAARAA